MFNDFFKAISQPISAAAHTVARQGQAQLQAAITKEINKGQAQLQAAITKEINKEAVSLSSMLFSSAATSTTDGSASDI